MSIIIADTPYDSNQRNSSGMYTITWLINFNIIYNIHIRLHVLCNAICYVHSVYTCIATQDMNWITAQHDPSHFYTGT